MPSMRRCVFGCDTAGVTIHNFPNPRIFQERFRIWVGLAGASVSGLTDMQIYKSRKVCDKHFAEKYKNRNSRLNAVAIPQLHISKASTPVASTGSVNLLSNSPCTPVQHSGLVGHETSPEVSNNPEPILDPLSTSNKSVTGLFDNETSAQTSESEPILGPALDPLEIPTDHEDSTEVIQSELILDLPSESDQHLTGLSDQETITQVSKSELILSIPSTSNKVLIGLSDDLPSPIFKQTSTCRGPWKIKKISPVLKVSKNKYFRYEPAPSQTETVKCPAWINNNSVKDHNYCAPEKTDPTKVVVPEPNYHQPTPPPIVNQLQTVRKKVKQLQAEVARLRKRNANTKIRLAIAKKNSKHDCLQKITQNMTAAAKVFTEMQFTQTQKKNSGRRYTLEGQRLCLSIYKSSPQCYDLLSKVFTLPSAKTLKSLIRKQFDIQPGVE